MKGIMPNQVIYTSSPILENSPKMTINLSKKINLCIFAHLKRALRCVLRLCAFLWGRGEYITYIRLILMPHKGGGAM